MIRLLGISGSLRTASYNSALLRAARDLLGPDVTLEIASLRGIPLYDEDERLRAWPPAVSALGEALRRADAVLIALPEYNFSIPGVLKNALDWVSRLPEQPFAGKPVALMGASTGRLGTARAQPHLRQCLQFLDARTLNKPELFVGQATQAFTPGPEPELRDAAARELLATLLAALLAAIGPRGH